MLRRLALPALLLLGASSHAMAAATPEEAQRLTGVFETYLGKEPGVVTVTPSGDSYDLAIDFAPYIAKMSDKSVTFKMSPSHLTLTPDGAGKWRFEQDQPFDFEFSVAGKLEVKGAAGKVKNSGVFDESLQAVASLSSDVESFAFQEVVHDQAKPMNVAYTIGKIHSDYRFEGSASDLKGTMASQFTDLRETFDLPPSPEMPATQLSVNIPSGSQVISLDGYNNSAVNGLLAWFIEHPGQQKIVAGQAELKDKLRAALPLWRNVSMTATYTNPSVSHAIGKFEFSQMGIEVEMSGIAHDARVREKITAKDPKLPPGLVPAWAESLMPQQLALDFSGSGFDLAAPAAKLIDVMDLSKNPPFPANMDAELGQLILPKGNFTFSLGPSQIVSRVFDLQAEGSISAGPAATPPSGSGTVKLKGIDEIMQVIQNAPPEMGLQQMAPMVIVAKGMGKQEADGFYSWKFESTPAGGMLVNGVDISKMGGQ